MKLIRSAEDLRRWRKGLDPQHSVGFVPTMGALHEGHAKLLHDVRARCDHSVLSIFVNPTQFGPQEDLARYPRSLESDLLIAEAARVDVVFAPSVDEIYPLGDSTWVEETTLSAAFCGPFRPGHFRGVCTVVLRLFNMVHPQLALFGKKDAQQLLVLQKMVRDLHLDVLVEGVETVREPSGLALSSRNRYMSSSERELAPRLYACLQEVASQLRHGEELAEVLEKGRETLQKLGFVVQYLDLRALPLLSPVSHYNPAHGHVLAAAAFLGTTRLIDNVFMD